MKNKYYVVWFDIGDKDVQVDVFLSKEGADERLNELDLEAEGNRKVVGVFYGSKLTIYSTLAVIHGNN